VRQIRPNSDAPSEESTTTRRAFVRGSAVAVTAAAAAAVWRPEAADAAPSPSTINVLDYGAQGDYDPSLPTSDPGNMTNLAANNTAFAQAWADAQAAKGMLLIPVGYYGIGPDILATSTNDAGIVGESMGNTVLFLIDPDGTGTCVSQSITDLTYWTTTTLSLRGRCLPPITGITIDGTFAGSGSVGLRVGPGVKGYWEVNTRYFDGTGGANGVAGLTGGIGILVQNAKAGGTDSRWTEECTFGPRTAVNHCTNGLVIDKGDGSFSFGYNTFEHLFIQVTDANATAVAIMNNAWLYHVTAHIKGNMAAGGATLFRMSGSAASPPDLSKSFSRVEGDVSIEVEFNPAGGVATSFAIDANSIWITCGLIDLMTFSGGASTTAISGRFHHTGPCSISPLPPVDGWISIGNWGASTRLSATSFTIPGSGDERSRFTRGTRVRWAEGGTLKYGVLDRDATNPGGVTTITLAANDDYQMNVSPDLGSLRFSHSNPPDFPGWFNYTPVFTGFSTPPPSGCYRFRVDGTRCEVELRDAANGTSNSTAFTIKLPIPCATFTDYAVAYPAQVTDNGATLSTPGVAQFGSASTVANIAKDYASTPWTVGGAGKRCNRVTLVYEI
jgi:hypothetical protein